MNYYFNNNNFCETTVRTYSENKLFIFSIVFPNIIFSIKNNIITKIIFW